MSQINENCNYTKEHEWIRKEDNSEFFLVGLTDFAQDQLGDVVFVELPEVGAEVKQGKAFGVVESVKTASDLLAPVSGEVVAINDSLENEPHNVNESPYENGWMIKIKVTNEKEFESLLSPSVYADLIAENE
ncbi:glycine cleavage system protein GcvH [Candidatus Riflebacteria bacterium]